MTNSSKIKSIEKSLYLNKENISLVGLNDGIIGYSLFYYYHYLLTNEEESYNKMVLFLENALEKLNEKYESYKVKIEIIEIGKYLLFLIEKGLIEKSHIENHLEVLDEVILDYLYEKINERDLDSAVGLLFAASYFLERNTEKTPKIIEEIVNLIEQTKFEDTYGIYWQFKLRNAKSPKVELGLGHGVAGVITFLLQLIKCGFEKNRAESLAIKALDFLISKKREKGINLFTINAFENETLDYNNLSYGDIGIGYTLFKAGEILLNKKYKELGLEILKNAAKYKDDNQTFIKDANIIYGSSGLFSVFNFLYTKTGIEIFNESKKYWLNKTLEFGEKDKEMKWAGYQTYFNSTYDFAQLGFSQGISGIGTALISNQIENDTDFLTFFNYN
ncbi:Lanthionine synthetase C-like protein [Flavobacterium columnare]|uniref:Lanthionine synthetase LanC family protein n=2 Tax=Flavobacterium TaxID=237 RepID=A0ABW8PNB9_9FLAO|nr:lanthionine synthetase LanC family protein [Flavobacterium columnare]SPE77537.1 Lanthionine synthetase C-like protein [Flavobacterium columnare]